LIRASKAFQPMCQHSGKARESFLYLSDPLRHRDMQM
jgi:hypothetical protein